MKTFGVLQKNVLSWAEERKLLNPKNKMAQALKTGEELNELQKAINCKNVEQIKDGIGDCLVTLIIQANMNGWTTEECLEYAYNIIKDRDGKTVNGMFVKNGDTKSSVKKKVVSKKK